MMHIRIEEVNHGTIGHVKGANNIIDWLVDNAWLDSDTRVYNTDRGEWITVKEYFGNDWKKVLSYKSISELEDIFDGLFYFYFVPTD